MPKYIKKKDLKNAIDECTWYHIGKNGELVEGANSSEHEPLYKYSDIKEIIKNLPTRKFETEPKRTALSKALKWTYGNEPNNSEKPNNCEYAENPSGDVWECGCFLDTYCEHQIYDRNPDGTINIVECGYEPKDEPTISKMEQVDKDINVRGKWETPPKFEHKGIITTCVSVPACLLEIEDEPQAERSE